MITEIRCGTAGRCTSVVLAQKNVKSLKIPLPLQPGNNSWLFFRGAGALAPPTMGALFVTVVYVPTGDGESCAMMADGAAESERRDRSDRNKFRRQRRRDNTGVERPCVGTYRPVHNRSETTQWNAMEKKIGNGAAAAAKTGNENGGDG